MRCLRKFCAIALLFISFSRLSADVSFKADWSKIDNNLSIIEWNLNALKTENQTLQSLYDEQVKFSTAQSLQSQDLELKLQKSERTMKKWKIGCITLGATTLLATTLLIIQMRR